MKLVKRRRHPLLQKLNFWDLEGYVICQGWYIRLKPNCPNLANGNARCKRDGTRCLPTGFLFYKAGIGFF